MATTDPMTLPMNDPKTAMILVDHGSRRDEANRVLDEIAGQIRRERKFPFVAVAHMELAEPTLEDAFKRCAQWGAERIVVVPYFLAPGNHSSGDIPRLTAEAAFAFPQIRWALAEPLGFDRRLAELVVSRAGDALKGLKADHPKGSSTQANLPGP